jgi:predicted dehydrogenase
MAKPGLTVGFIGTGGEARHYLAGCVHSGLVARAVLAEPDEEARAQMRQRFGLIKADHAEPATLLSDPEVQVVVVCAALAERAATARQALAAGKHVILDAPPAQTAAELRELATLAQERGVRLLCATSALHMPAHLKLDELLQRDPLPPALLVSAMQAAVAPDDGRVPASLRDALWTGAYQTIAALQHFLGAAVRVAGATVGAQALAATLLLADDVPAQVAVVLGQPEERPWGERRIITAEGFVLLRDNPEDEWPLIIGQGAEVMPVKVKAPPDVYEYAAAHAMEHLLDCVVNDRPERVPLAEALAATATLDALRQAAARDGVDLPPVTDSVPPSS